MKRLITYFLFILLLVGCEKEKIPEQKVFVDIDDPAYKAGFEEAMKRAKVMTSIVWTPLSAIPKTRPEGEFFEAGKKYKGIPYSSVKELNKFVGQDVSFYTFVSATRNPRSVLYTEFVNLSPYHGTNCSPYYGTVCSMSVNYALGIDVPFASKHYKNQPFMVKISDKGLDLIEPGDILASEGHTIMIAEVERGDDDRIINGKYFENSGFYSFTREELDAFWKDQGFIHYRYALMSKVRFEPVDLPDDGIPAICVNRGDRSIYRKGENVVVNVLQNQGEEMILRKNGHIVDRISNPSPDVNFSNLDEGLYSASLVHGGEEYGVTDFEVRTIRATASKKKKTITVDFSGNSIPATAIELCEITGSHLYTYAVVESDRSSGHVSIPSLGKRAAYYCKVIFQGEYGKIASEYIPIK